MVIIERVDVFSGRIMLKGFIIFAFVFTGCHAENSTAPQQGVYCGDTPDVVYACLDNPKIISGDAVSQCIQHSSECDRMKCIFSKLGWLDGEKVNKKKVSDYLDQFAVQHPAWSPSVNHAKAACASPDHDVLAQGVFLNCLPYDIMHCVLTSFIRNATPSQWKSTASCQYSRSYAASCPVCPGACFAQQVPYGSCNACLSLPRSA